MTPLHYAGASCPIVTSKNIAVYSRASMTRRDLHEKRHISTSYWVTRVSSQQLTLLYRFSPVALSPARSAAGVSLALLMKKGRASLAKSVKGFDVFVPVSQNSTIIFINDNGSLQIMCNSKFFRVFSSRFVVSAVVKGSSALLQYQYLLQSIIVFTQNKLTIHIDRTFNCADPTQWKKDRKNKKKII